MPQLVELLAALVALRKLGARLAASLEWHTAIFAPAAAAAATAALGSSSAAAVLAELTQLVRASHASVGAEPEDSDADDSAQYWTVALKLADRCALSLMPLQSEAFPQMPPSVTFDGARMHAPCANLSARLESAPPAA